MSALRLEFSALRPDAVGGQGVDPVTGAPADAQVLALAREDAHAALEVVYGAYKVRVYTFLLRFTADPELSDDIVQDTFAKALVALPTLAREQRVLPWLFRVAHNAAIDQLRRRKRFQWLRLPQLAGTRHEPESVDGQAQIPEREHIAAVLRTIAPENAAALLLHALEGYSYKEIAQIQGCSLTAVRSRIARAREAFRVAYATTEPPRSSSG
ncbi:MAG: RNA polymerase sigma factor [Candidatus Limnocylindria bacterium]